MAEKTEMERTEENLAMTKRLLAMRPSDLLELIRVSSSNPKIQGVFVTAYKARSRDLLEEALKESVKFR